MISNSIFGQRQVAIVGSGPSGFYAAEALLRSECNVAVDVYEKLPVPFGLTRFGVAPDHPKLKLVINTFERIAQMEDFRFIGNVCVGKDVSVDTLSEYYHAIIFACGAESEKNLNIPGEDMKGSHSAREFVAWYNGHPDYRDISFDFSHERVVVIGQGNVALDVARILSRTIEELRYTDIADYALEALADSKIKEIYIVGRRGPVQAKFSDKELREFDELADCEPVVSINDMQVNFASQQELENSVSSNNANLTLFNNFLKNTKEYKSRTCHFKFYHSPVEIIGDNRVEGIVLEKNRLNGEAFQQQAVPTGQLVTLGCGMVLRCIGYQAVPIPGLPYNQKSRVLSHREGRLCKNDTIFPGLYATGWVKRGASGTIGSNRGDSVATVQAILEDFQIADMAKPTSDILLEALKNRGCQIVSYSDWEKINTQEVARGALVGKPREKFTTVSDMLGAVQQQS